MKKQANKTASSGSSDKDSSAESSAPEEGESSGADFGVNSYLVEAAVRNGGKRCLHYNYSMASAFIAGVSNLFNGHGLFRIWMKQEKYMHSKALVMPLKPIQETHEDSLR